MILERDISITGMLDWIQAEAQSRQVNITIFRNDAEERTEQYRTAGGIERSITYVIVRVRIDNVPDPGKQGKIMVDIQETWNNSEPRPDKLLHLIPSGIPQGVW